MYQLSFRQVTLLVFLFRHGFQNIFDLLEENGQFFSIFLGSNPYHQLYRAMTQQAEQYISPYHDSKVLLISYMAVFCGA